MTPSLYQAALRYGLAKIPYLLIRIRFRRTLATCFQEKMFFSIEAFGEVINTVQDQVNMENMIEHTNLVPNVFPVILLFYATNALLCRGTFTKNIFHLICHPYARNKLC